jgi:acetylornithine deacetylase
MLTGHIDVVPPGAPEHWMSDPFAPVVSEGFVRGRGTVDMKGGVAMLMAIGFQEIGVTLAGDVVFTTVVDEKSAAWGRCYGRSWLSRRRRDHDRADRQSHAPLCHGIPGPDHRRRHRRSRRTHAEPLGRERPVDAIEPAGR